MPQEAGPGCPGAPRREVPKPTDLPTNRKRTYQPSLRTVTEHPAVPATSFPPRPQVSTGSRCPPADRRAASSCVAGRVAGRVALRRGILDASWGNDQRGDSCGKALPAISYISMLAAHATFSESTVPAIGMRTIRSTIPRSCTLSPLASFPSRRTTGFSIGFPSATDTLPIESVPTQVSRGLDSFCLSIQPVSSFSDST